MTEEDREKWRDVMGRLEDLLSLVEDIICEEKPAPVASANDRHEEQQAYLRSHEAQVLRNQLLWRIRHPGFGPYAKDEDMVTREQLTTLSQATEDPWGVALRSLRGEEREHAERIAERRANAEATAWDAQQAEEPFS